MPNQNANVAEAFKHHPLYPEFIQVKNKLKARGFICWIAGGAVRDVILNRTPADFDLVTNATTDQIIEIFPEALMVGVQFGVVKLVLPHQQFFDLSTFRRESDYLDGRRPSKIDFATPEEDAFRRDFTMNALFWDEEAQIVVDYVTGLNDIYQGKIKCVGIPSLRFQEDHLRLLRLLRFSVQFQFQMDEETLKAATAQIKSLEKISGERIWAEMIKMSKFIKWSVFLKNPFARTVIQSLFPIQLENSLTPKLQDQLTQADQKTSDSLVKLFYFLIRLSKAEDVLFKMLKNRLRISKLEVGVFESIRFCLQNENQFSLNEWVYEIEKKPALLEVLNFFETLGIRNDFPLIQEKFLCRPDKKIDGYDLKGQVEAVKMAEVLKKIRLLQFEQPHLSKQEILENLIQNKIISIKHEI